MNEYQNSHIWFENDRTDLHGGGDGGGIPADARRNNSVSIMSKRRHNVVLM